MVGLVSLFNDISTFKDYLIPKPSLDNSNNDSVQPIAKGINGFIPFPKRISPKVNSTTVIQTHSLPGHSLAI